MVQDGKIIKNKISHRRTDVFEIVDHFPEVYIVWPIGRRNFPYEGYIPLGKPIGETFCIDLGSLKALKVHEGLADFLLYQAVLQANPTIVNSSNANIL